ncbi:Oxygen-independent coproporphyrinogen-III oxidase 1 [compost metagenome]
MLEGASASRFSEQFGESIEEVFAKPLGKMLNAGLLERTPGGFRLSEQGILFGNDVFAEFIGSISLNS